jgi:hypothetical protein
MPRVNTLLFRGQIMPGLPFRPGHRVKRGGPFRPLYTNASAVSAGAGPYFSGAIVKLALPWLTLRTAAE